jgi:YVTN family beta-propeller protein
LLIEVYRRHRARSDVRAGSTPDPLTFNADQAVFSPDGTRAYISQTRFSQTGPSAPVLTVIDVANSTAIDTVVLGSTDGAGGALAEGVAISPDGKKVYVVNLLYSAGAPFFTSQISIIDTATDTIIGTISIGADAGISITPDGTKLYAVDSAAGVVTVVDTATNTATAIIPVGAFPNSVGNFIQPAPKFAGTPGRPSCIGVSLSALASQYGGLNNAAPALGFNNIIALQNAMMEFCEG